MLHIFQNELISVFGKLMFLNVAYFQQPKMKLFTNLSEQGCSSLMSYFSNSSPLLCTYQLLDRDITEINKYI